MDKEEEVKGENPGTRAVPTEVQKGHLQHIIEAVEFIRTNEGDANRVRTLYQLIESLKSLKNAERRYDETIAKLLERILIMPDFLSRLRRLFIDKEKPIRETTIRILRKLLKIGPSASQTLTA